MNGVFDSLLDRLDSTFPIKTVLNHIVSQDEFIEFLLQVVVLKGQDVCMVLKSVQFLLVAMACFEQPFVAGTYGFKFTADASKLCIELHVFVLRHSHVVVELMRLYILAILLSIQLALGFL